MKRVTVFVPLLVLSLALPSGWWPARSDAPGTEDGKTARSRAPADPQLSRILREFDRAQRETGSLVAEFTEKKQLKLLAHPVVSRGELYYNRPNQVRWEYLEPDHKVFVITEDLYVAYYPTLKRAEEVPIKKFVGKRLFRFIGLGQSIDDLGKYYDFTLADASDLPDTWLLLLTPRKQKIREKMTDMRIWVDKTTFMPRQLRYEEADGDWTMLAFQNMRLNIEVAAQRFHIDLPKDVVVSETFNGFSLGEQSF
jgi:outer membrane lipoprotein carrier protein